LPHPNFSTRRIGFLIVQGRSVAGCKLLCELADGMIFYLDQRLTAVSQQRHLEALGQWDLPESRPEELPDFEQDDVIATRLEEIRNANNFHWYLLFEHYKYNDYYQRQTATRVLAVGTKSIEDVATELTKAVQHRILLYGHKWPGPSDPTWIASASKEERFSLLTSPWQALSRAWNALIMTRFTASPKLALYVLATQVGAASGTNTTVTADDSPSTWWFGLVTTLTVMCWTALFFKRSHTRLIQTADASTQADVVPVPYHGPDRIVITYSGNCYHLDGCQITRVPHSDPNAALLRNGTRYLKRCKICMPDRPAAADLDERERNRGRLRVPELVELPRLNLDELFTSPATVTLIGLGFIGAHIEPGNTWNTRRHWEEGCSQSCGCCRATNYEDWPSGCECCVDLWYFRGLKRG
jgi:hypothetical protein